jgi:MFS family permease
MRTRLPETTEFTNMFKNNTIAINPTYYILQKFKLKLMIATGIVCLGACSFSMWFVWLPSYLKLYSELDSGHILMINSINLLVIIIIIPLVGLLSDKIGEKIILGSAALSIIVLISPILIYMNQLTLVSVWLSQLGLAILARFVYGVIPVTLFKIFPASVRCSGISISYNIANMIFGGGIPLIASIILTRTSNLIFLCIPIIITAIIMIGVTFFISKQTIKLNMKVKIKQYI